MRRSAKPFSAGRWCAASLIFVLAIAASAGCSVSGKKAAYEGYDRDAWQKPDEVIEMLSIAPGSAIADLGSGSGYFTGRLARATGSDGTVYAVDVDEEMNAYLAERMREEGVDNVEIITAAPDDAGLPTGAIDLVFTSNTFHHLPEPQSYFARLREALAPGARVAVLEYSGETGGFFVKWFGHSTEPDEIRRAMEAAGYRLASDRTLERQSLLIFRPAGG